MGVATKSAESRSRGRRISASDVYRGGAGGGSPNTTDSFQFHYRRTPRGGRAPRQRGRRGRATVGKREKNPARSPGVPFAVQRTTLFDVQGLPTRAGSRSNRGLRPSPRDGPPLVEGGWGAAGQASSGGAQHGRIRLRTSLAKNVHDGAFAQNPNDVKTANLIPVPPCSPPLLPAGSSGRIRRDAVGGGTGAAGARSDTNGSIRVPSSFCEFSALKRPMAGCRGRASVNFVAEARSSRPFRAQCR